MIKCLVTGSNGFIGSSLLNELKKRDNIEIRTLERDKYDLLDKKSLNHLVEDLDFIFHLAGLSSRKELPEDLLKTNVLGTLNLLEAIKEKKTKFIFPSTFNSYSVKQDKTPLKEHEELQPINFYGLTKKQAEEVIFNSGIEGIIFRISNVFGPGLRPEYTSVISTFVYRALNNEKITISGDGEQIRDFIYVEDVVKMLTKCLDIEISGLNVYNLCSGEGHSLNQALGVIEKQTQKNVSRGYKGDSPSLHQIGDNTKIKKIFDFQPKYSFEEGIRKVVNYFQNDQK